MHLLGIVAFVSANPVHAQDSASLLQAIEKAERAAHAAEDAAKAANEALAELRTEQAAKKLQDDKILPETGRHYAIPRDATPRLADWEAYEVCNPKDMLLTSREYFRRAGPCEGKLIRDQKINPFKSRITTGIGTSISTGSTGTSAIFKIGRTQAYRKTFVGNFGRGNPNVEQQRTVRSAVEFGLRADIDKGSKTTATIATFGALDRLQSNVAGFLQFGYDYSTAEPYESVKGIAGPDGVTFPEVGRWTSKSSLVSNRAAVINEQLTKDCRKSEETACEGADLLAWIFRSKARQSCRLDKKRDCSTEELNAFMRDTDLLDADDPGEFAHPEAVKLYNTVFWGPPRDAEPRWGWMVRAEVARPRFSYFPFATTQVPDPFNPGRTRTAIDPALFPTDFGARLTTDVERINFGLTGRAFFHLSRRRSFNQIREDAPWLRRFAGWTMGTTGVGSLTYKREDSIDEASRSVRICPPAVSGQAFATDQTCSTLNVAAPRRHEGVVLAGELRQGIEPNRILPPALVAAKLSYDTDTTEYGLVVPLYFAADDKGIFTGGLRVAHTWNRRNADGTRREPETVVGVVIGASLGLNGNTGMD